MKISEVFYSIQGEGYHTGMAAIFVRFHGCNLNCEWCDTKYANTGEYKTYNSSELMKEIKKYPCKNVVLTGGEPTIQDLTKFVNKLYRCGYYVCMETNGVICPSWLEYIDWITMSPKTNDYFGWYDELKVVYFGQDLRKYNNKFKKNAYYYLQPLNNKNIQETIDAIKRNPRWRLSLQIHKFLNIQ